MSIAEYETKFNELSCYGPGLIDTSLKKNEMFVQGLRPEYHERMTAHLKGSFVELIDMALRYEDLMKKRSVAQVAASGGNSSNQNKRKFNPNWKKQNKKKSGNNNGPRKCYNCNQMGHLANHCPQERKQQQQRQQYSGPGSALVQKSLCFNCHQPGHMIKDCPLLHKVQQNKVFALEGAPSNSSKGKGVLEGTLLLNGKYIKVLFDSGASLSFISLGTVENFLLTPNIVDNPIYVSNPIGGVTKLDRICKDLRVYYLSHSFSCEPYVLDFKGFDLILGMDWLDKYKAVLNCDERTVSLETDLGRIARVMCDNSGIHLSSLLHGVETSQEEVEDIEVVRDSPKYLRKLIVCHRTEK